MDLALQHHMAGRLPMAESIYNRILQADPSHYGALHMLGVIAHQMGNNDIAVDLIMRVLVMRPDYADAHSNLGLALRDLGNLDGAVASYHKALAIKPDMANAHNNLGAALQELGRPEEAFSCHRRAVALDPRNESCWAGLAVSLETLSFTSIDENLLQDLLLLLERPTVHPSDVVRPIVSALRLHSGFSKILELTCAGNPEIGTPYADVAEQLSAIPLFLRIMGLSPIHDLEIELMLTFLRRAMIEAVAGNTDETGLPFSAALALQCFTNEYVFPETDKEKSAVENLQRQVATLVQTGRDVPPTMVAALGAFRPLHGFPWARELAEREWAGDIRDVIERQISEPLEERSLRPGIPCLTAIRNNVSQSVREQYEENPYPRWIKTGMRVTSNTIGAVLRGPRSSLTSETMSLPRARKS